MFSIEDGGFLEMNNLLNRDFTLMKYNSLCKALIDSDYVPLTVVDYLKSNNDSLKSVVLRHDVDKWPQNALLMAQIESKFNIKSTYYFRAQNNVFNPQIIKKISDLGHEIGYHYETMHKAKGDEESALQIFEANLCKFRDICKIETICMHGNSLSKWNNLDLWKHYNYKDYNIIGEAYLSFDFSQILYFSDSGGTWDNSKIRIKDITVGKSISSPKEVKNTQDLIELVVNGSANNLYLLSHPDRWNDSLSIWIYEYMWKKIRNTGKFVVKKIIG
ncbi:hypothetical protein [Methanolobus vulcani]|uniref:Polysaccharide deacetylase n=1 Tax=Methanolobus vulcani TaxID=38026 RepID=A0A7Z8KPX3_9EURY|nr:hypothetical protein [Methanolobus vulcani]TQD27259.1 hypothetical protein FKV42_03265 [Methanolobus vulcani]